MGPAAPPLRRPGLPRGGSRCYIGAVEAILESLPVYMMIGIIIVIGVSQFHRVAGAILSVVFWTAVAIVGSVGYDRGHGIGLPGLQFSRGLFLAVCGSFALLHTWAAFSAVQRKRRQAELRQRRAEEED